MGIKGLNKIIKKEAPNAYQDVHISEYAYKKIAVDISLYVCKFKAVCGDRWISAFINLVTCLRRNNVHCVFVYDTGAPPEKEREREERSAQRAKATKNIEDLEEGLKNYIRHGTVSDYLEKTSLKLLKGAPKRLMAGGFDSSTRKCWRRWRYRTTPSWTSASCAVRTTTRISREWDQCLCIRTS